MERRYPSASARLALEMLADWWPGAPAVSVRRSVDRHGFRRVLNGFWRFAADRTACSASRPWAVATRSYKGHALLNHVSTLPAPGERQDRGEGDQPLRETPRQRFHIDVQVPYDIADQRIAAAVAAGAVIVDDSRAPWTTIIADPDGNKACVGTFQAAPAQER